MTKVTALIPAAGMGKRMGKGIAKQFLSLGGKPILAHTLLTFQKSPKINEIIPILSPKDIEFCLREIIETYRISKVKFVVEGGKERQDSVANGLEKLDTETDIVLVHDGVRPFVTETMIRQCVEFAEKGECVSVGVPVKDTIKEVNVNGFVRKTLDRNVLWAVQTPQAFPCAILTAAHQTWRHEKQRVTDDATLVEQTGHLVRMIPGSYDNIKITTPEDLLIAEEFLRNR